MDILNETRLLARAIASAVLPRMGKASARAIDADTRRDVQFRLDTFAENALFSHAKKRKLPIAYISEDRNLVKIVPKPDYLLVVDPIDGSRAAISNLEGCCVSIALAPYSEKLKVKDVGAAVVREIKSGADFYCEEGKGVKITRGNRTYAPSLSKNSNTRTMLWSFELCSQPIHHLGIVMRNLINNSSLRGGAFVLNSCTFSLTRIMQGDMDAYADIAPMFYRELPEEKAQLDALSEMKGLGLHPYDFAAAHLLSKEAGMEISNGYGNSLGNADLLDMGKSNMHSCVAASTKELHAKMIAGISAGFARLRKNSDMLPPLKGAGFFLQRSRS